MRRSLLAIAFLFLAGTTFAQRREGNYHPTNGKAATWSINDHQTLVWDGQPYLPVGIRIDGTVAAVQAAKADGVTDVIVDLPASGAGWDEVFDALNKSGMRFLIRVDSLAPMANGFTVEPQGYRISGITKKQTVSLELPGATSAFVVLANQGDGQIISSARVPVTNGLVVYDANPGAEIDHVLLVYPELTSIEQPDFWESLDSHRDSLLAALKRHPAGSGLRGIVNPMGRSIALPGREPRFVPTSSAFRMEFRSFLEDKYKSVETLLKTWSMTSSDLSLMSTDGLSKSGNPTPASVSQKDDKKKLIATFDQFARLIPLWNNNRGVGAMLDPTTNKIYSCDNKRSKVWDDISSVINAAGERRFNRLVPAVRSVVDVPVVQDWLGWSAPYENAHPAVDGIGMRASGTTQSALMDSGSRATSSILRWRTNGWLVATDLDLSSSTDAVSALPSVLDDLGSLGAKGIFVRADTKALTKAVVSESGKRASDTSLSTSSPLPVFFPENAYNPAVPQRLPGGHWWLPCPADGDRIDMGSMFYAYRLKLDSGIVALWAKKAGRYRLKMMNTKSVKFQTLDGSLVDPKLVKGALEVNLSEVPTLITGTDELPIPELAFIETVDRFRAMLAVGQRFLRDMGQEEFAFMDNMNAFERNPGGSFTQLRSAYWKLSQKVSPYCWIEGEHTSDTNFSEVINVPGCASGGALALRTTIPVGSTGYYAVYPIPVKTKEDQEVWIAAKVPVERRGDLTVQIGGQILRISGDPVSLYGAGYGWYKLGTTRLAGNLSRLRIQVDTPGNAEIAIDTVLVTPEPFQPNGVYPPDATNFRQLQLKQPVKTQKKKRGSGAP